MIQRGITKPWSNPSDVAPDSEDGITRIGRRVVEEGTIAAKGRQ